MSNFWHLENIDVTQILCPNKVGNPEVMDKHPKSDFKKGEPVYIHQKGQRVGYEWVVRKFITRRKWPT